MSPRVLHLLAREFDHLSETTARVARLLRAEAGLARCPVCGREWDDLVPGEDATPQHANDWKSVCPGSGRTLGPGE